MNCFSHFAQFSKLPTGGLAGELENLDFDNAVYMSSSSLPSSSSTSLRAFFFAWAFFFASAALLSFGFLVGLAAAEGGSSSSSETYPEAYMVFGLCSKGLDVQTHRSCSRCAPTTWHGRRSHFILLLSHLMILILVSILNSPVPFVLGDIAGPSFRWISASSRASSDDCCGDS